MKHQWHPSFEIKTDPNGKLGIHLPEPEMDRDTAEAIAERALESTQLKDYLVRYYMGTLKAEYFLLGINMQKEEEHRDLIEALREDTQLALIESDDYEEHA